MTVALYFLIPIAVAATAVVLVAGIIGFARGGRFNAQYGNKLMQARVGLQFVAVMLVMLFLLIEKA